MRPLVRAVRADAAARMRRLARTGKHSLAVDLRLDAQAVLPGEVAREAERAALALIRLSACPYGTPTAPPHAGPTTSAITSHQRYYERFCIGSIVPLLDVVADSGIGWPDGYPGTVTPERRSPVSGRDGALLALAQGAALDSRDEVVLDDQLIATLELSSWRPRLPPHLELGVRVHACGLQALRAWRLPPGDRVRLTGRGRADRRFLSVLAPQHRAGLAAGLAALPGGDRETVSAQLSFPPVDPATAPRGRRARPHRPGATSRPRPVRLAPGPVRTQLLPPAPRPPRQRCARRP